MSRTCKKSDEATLLLRAALYLDRFAKVVAAAQDNTRESDRIALTALDLRRKHKRETASAGG